MMKRRAILILDLLALISSAMVIVLRHRNRR
jgi:hypothetical protein